MIYSNNTYDITNDISTYTRTDFSSVYDTTRAKWFMLNNTNEYEEYGIYGDSLDTTKYVGKLVEVDGHEYEWDGTEWIDLGEYIETIIGWTLDAAVNYSINYNGSNYVLQATKNDVEINFFSKLSQKTAGIAFLLSSATGDNLEYEVFYASSVQKLLYDLGNSHSRRLESAMNWEANTNYNLKCSNGNYLYTNRQMTLNGIVKAQSNTLSSYDNTSDRIAMNCNKDYYYIKDITIYESTGAVFNIKAHKDGNDYCLYDSLGNGQLYNYGTQDQVVVTPVMTSQRPKDYDTKTAPTITKYYASTIFRNSNHYTKFMQNDAEIGKLDYMSKDVVLKG